MTTAPPVLLRVRNLKTYFVTEQGKGTARAVDDVSFDLYPGETLGIVGESGCGKTVTSLSILRLVPEPPGHVLPGSLIEFEGRNLLALSAPELRAVRGNQIAMIFQEPMTSLNPVFTIGDQIAEAGIIHQHLSRGAARARAIEMLRLVGIPDPDERVDHYPHQLSGGMRQRVMIAMALVCHPKVLIADEPTTALDVTIQAQILELLDRLQHELGMAVLLITHDLGVVAGHADRVVVMYAGRIVETAPTDALFERPTHPYTEGLLAAVPRIDTPRARLHAVPGQVPAATAWPSGCRFHPRCPYAWDKCVSQEPPLLEVEDLRVEFPTPKGSVRAADGVSFRVWPSEIVGLVGESGCGKSVTTLALMRLVRPPGRFSVNLTRAAHAFLKIGHGSIEKSQFPDEVPTARGFVLQRPNSWKRSVAKTLGGGISRR